MNTLSDYVGLLKRGDWIKFIDGQWQEVAQYDREAIGDKPVFVIPTGWRKFTDAIEAVLRPSIIIRDTLDEAYEKLKLQSSAEHCFLIRGEFTLIHPRKEEAKSFELKTVLQELDGLRTIGETLISKCNLIEKRLELDKELLASQSKSCK